MAVVCWWRAWRQSTARRSSISSPFWTAIYSDMVATDLVKATFLVTSALFPIVNPLGGSPIFLTLTREYDRPERQALSRLIAMNSFFLLVGSYLIGTHILAFFGIS